MKNRNRLLLATCLLTLASCTTAGPFVTSISSDGLGNLVIEKAMVHYNPFTATITNKDVTTTRIRVSD